MAQTQKKNSTYNEEVNYTVYVILHPHTHEFFVHFAATTALRNAMKQHYTLNNIHTREMFEEHKETIYPPEMYALEEKEMSRGDCFIKKILWIRYFMERKFTPLNHQDDITSAWNLFEENQPEYESMKQINLADIICNKNRKFPHYGRERMEPVAYADKKQINFRVTDEEYEIIRNNAKKNGQTLTAYIKEVALYRNTINVNYEAILEHINIINKIKTEMNAVITMLVRTNQAFPIDIEEMISQLKELNQSEKLMLQKLQNERQQLKKYIKKLLSKQEKETKNEK